jgi:hypothetical protein
MSRPRSKGALFDEGKEPTVQFAGVAGRWPETFGLGVKGRAFTDTELESQAPVALVNERLAATFWPNENPIGTPVPTRRAGAQPVAHRHRRGARHPYVESSTSPA